MIKLTLKNFKRYDTETTFTIPKSGLVLLQGASGIGKTSILDAIYFVLYGVGSKIVNFSATSCSVSMQDGNTSIKRTKKPNRLVLQEDDSTYEDAVAQEIINNRYGTSFEITSYIKYKASTSFFSLGPSARMEFLQGIAIKGTDVQSLKTNTKEAIRNRKENLLKIGSEIKVVELEFNILEEPEEVKFPFGKFHETKIKNHKIKGKNNKIKLSNTEKAFKQTMKSQKEYELQQQTISFIEERIEKETAKLEKYSDKLQTLKFTDIQPLKKTLAILEGNKRHDELQSQINVLEKQLTECKKLEELKRDEELQRLQKIPLIQDETHYYLQCIQTRQNILTTKNKLETDKKSLEDLDNVSEEKIDVLVKSLENAKGKRFICPGCSCVLILRDEKLSLTDSHVQQKDIKAIETEIQSMKKRLDIKRKLEASVETGKQFLQKLLKDAPLGFDLSVDYDKLYKQHSEQIKYGEEVRREISKLKSVKYSPAVVKMENDINILMSSLSSYDYISISTEYTIDSLKELIIKAERDNDQYTSLKTKIDEITNYIEQEKTKLDKLKHSVTSGGIQNFPQKILEIEKEIEQLKKDIITHEEDDAKLTLYLRYVEKRENYNKWRSRLESLRFSEINATKSLYIAEKFLTIVNETESKAVANIINSINIQLKYYSEQFFTEPIGIQIYPFKESQNGNIKPSVSIKVSYKGMDYDVDCLSGGETSRVELAVCLAINSVINGRILLLDEVLGTLNAGYIDTITSVLREEALKENKLILTVLHGASEGNFDHVVSIE